MTPSFATLSWRNCEIWLTILSIAQERRRNKELRDSSLHVQGCRAWVSLGLANLRTNQDSEAQKRTHRQDLIRQRPRRCTKCRETPAWKTTVTRLSWTSRYVRLESYVQTTSSSQKLSVTTTKTLSRENWNTKAWRQHSEKNHRQNSKQLRASLYKNTCSQPRNQRHLNQNSSFQIANTILHYTCM